MSPSTSATTVTSPAPAGPDRRLSLMSVPALAEAPAEPATPATVAHLPHPLDPTPEQTAARKARRRISTVTYSRTRSGSYRARYYNAAGFDAYGHTEDGAYQEDQAIMTSPSPFTASISTDQETTMATTQDTPAPRVIVYSKPSCPQCNATYRGLTKKGIEYDVVDVSADEEALAHVRALGYQQVPVVESTHQVEGVPAHWYGYRPDYITLIAASLAEVTV